MPWRERLHKITCTPITFSRQTRRAPSRVPPSSNLLYTPSTLSKLSHPRKTRRHPPSRMYTSSATSKSKRRSHAAAAAAAAAVHARPELSDEQKQEIKEAFELFDTDKDGAV